MGLPEVSLDARFQHRTILLTQPLELRKMHMAQVCCPGVIYTLLGTCLVLCAIGLQNSAISLSLALSVQPGCALSELDPTPLPCTHAGYTVSRVSFPARPSPQLSTAAPSPLVTGTNGTAISHV
jgi:hypothetical protein